MKYLTALTLLTLASPALAAPYPADMRRNFTQNCVGFNQELVEPCDCILKRLERSIPKETFEKLLASGKASSDPRVQGIMRECSGQ